MVLRYLSGGEDIAVMCNGQGGGWVQGEGSKETTGNPVSPSH